MVMLVGTSSSPLPHSWMWLLLLSAIGWLSCWVLLRVWAVTLAVILFGRMMAMWIGSFVLSTLVCNVLANLWMVNPSV